MENINYSKGNRVLVTGFGNGDNVMIFSSTLNAKNISDLLTKREAEFDDCLDIAKDDIQYYSFEPLWLDEIEEIRFVNEL